MKSPYSGTFSFLGSGIITEVWLIRLLSCGWLTPGRVMVCDPRADRCQDLAERFGVLVGSGNRQGAAFGDVIVLAPPPSEVVKVVREIAPRLTIRKTVISLAAGVPLYLLDRETSPAQCVRVMPNTPGEVGEAMSLVCYSELTHPDTQELVESMLGVLGEWFKVKDEQMEAWCALCAVGPTYVFPVIAALAAAASSHGLPKAEALEAAAEVVAGAARMVQKTGRRPAELSRMISIHTLRELDAAALFTEAYEEALAKLQGLTKKLASAA